MRGFEPGNGFADVSRGALSVGEVLLVELRPTAASALILGLTPNQVILSGDRVAVKVS